MAIGEFVKTADFKSEKHVPVIECESSVVAGGQLTVKLSVGKEIPHPNTTAHHIRWITLFFKAAEGNITEVATLDFAAHAESVKGADEGAVLADSMGCVIVKLKTSGTLIATSYCNIHGLWESSKEITVS